MDADRADLVRYWFEFDVSAYVTPRQARPDISLDGGHPIHNLLWMGVGVTGFDEADCLRMLSDVLSGVMPGAVLPPLTRAEMDVDVSSLHLAHLGNPAWRGVWYPRVNAGGPTLL
ncbi:MAG: hypothetical protein QOI95_3052 [Acidimicrobiaceae bacterium]|jgi:hypothetical protein